MLLHCKKNDKKENIDTISNPNNSIPENKVPKDTLNIQNMDSMPSMVQKKDNTYSKNKIKETKEKKVEINSLEIDQLLISYFDLKNALVTSDPESSAVYGKKLLEELQKIESKKITSSNQKIVMSFLKNTKPSVENIIKNNKNIELQRQSFINIGSQIEKLLEISTYSSKIYQDFCPMANNGNGGYWLSESEEIRNPYYGDAMMSCGYVKKTYSK